MVLPPLVAAVAAFRALRGRPLTWDRVALAGCGGGLVAGVRVRRPGLVVGRRRRPRPDALRRPVRPRRARPRRARVRRRRPASAPAWSRSRCGAPRVRCPPRTDGGGWSQPRRPSRTGTRAAAAAGADGPARRTPRARHRRRRRRAVARRRPARSPGRGSTSSAARRRSPRSCRARQEVRVEGCRAAELELLSGPGLAGRGPGAAALRRPGAGGRGGRPDHRVLHRAGARGPAVRLPGLRPRAPAAHADDPVRRRRPRAVALAWHRRAREPGVLARPDRGVHPAGDHGGLPAAGRRGRDGGGDHAGHALPLPRLRRPLDRGDARHAGVAAGDRRRSAGSSRGSATSPASSTRAASTSPASPPRSTSAGCCSPAWSSAPSACSTTSPSPRPGRCGSSPTSTPTPVPARSSSGPCGSGARTPPPPSTRSCSPTSARRCRSCWCSRRCRCRSGSRSARRSSPRRWCAGSSAGSASSRRSR